MEKEYKCKNCRKTIEPDDEFMVRDDLWKDFCKKEAWQLNVIVCKRCYENLTRKSIEASDLKVSGISGGDLPINLRIITGIWKRNPAQARTRIPFLVKGKDYLVNLFIDHGDQVRAEHFQQRYDRVLALLSEKD